eukprot:scaffold273984_cov18-Tisochrysis_lutea.AAC.1
MECGSPASPALPHSPSHQPPPCSVQEARRYTDVDDTDNESEAGPTPSTQGGGIFGLFKGTTPQNYKQQPGAAAAKRIK